MNLAALANNIKDSILVDIVKKTQILIHNMVRKSG